MTQIKEALRKEIRSKPCVIGFGCKYAIPGQSEVEHVRTRGAFGIDHPDNLMPICRKHHIEKGNKGISHMADRYPKYKKWLISHNWVFIEPVGKWVNTFLSQQ